MFRFWARITRCSWYSVNVIGDFLRFAVWRPGSPVSFLFAEVCSWHNTRILTEGEGKEKALPRAAR